MTFENGSSTARRRRHAPSLRNLFPYALGLAVATSVAAPARAGEPTDLNEFFPVTVEDAEPTKYGTADVRAQFRYDNLSKDSRGNNLFVLLPQVEIGVLPNFSIGLGFPYQLGNSSESYNGEAELRGQYLAVEEKGWIPALGFTAGVNAPYGAGVGGPESLLEFLASKRLGAGSNSPQLLLNVTWLHIFDRDSEERTNRYQAAFGVLQPIGADTAVVIDVVREQQRQSGQQQNLVEAGVRRRIWDGLVLNLGAGVGIGDDSPDFRVLIGFEKSLSLF
jgi:hypothetical protein